LKFKQCASLTRPFYVYCSKNQKEEITCDSANLAEVNVVGDEAGDVGADGVADEVEGVRRGAAHLVEEVEELGDAARAEAGSPPDLAEARLLHQRAVVDDHDVVLAPVEVGCRNSQHFFMFYFYLFNTFIVYVSKKPVWREREDHNFTFAQ